MSCCVDHCVIDASGTYWLAVADVSETPPVVTYLDLSTGAAGTPVAPTQPCEIPDEEVFVGTPGTDPNVAIGTPEAGRGWFYDEDGAAWYWDPSAGAWEQFTSGCCLAQWCVLDAAGDQWNAVVLIDNGVPGTVLYLNQLTGVAGTPVAPIEPCPTGGATVDLLRHCDDAIIDPTAEQFVTEQSLLAAGQGLYVPFDDSGDGCTPNPPACPDLPQHTHGPTGKTWTWDGAAWTSAISDAGGQLPTFQTPAGSLPDITTSNGSFAFGIVEPWGAEIWDSADYCNDDPCGRDWVIYPRWSSPNIRYELEPGARFQVLFFQRVNGTNLNVFHRYGDSNNGTGTKFGYLNQNLGIGLLTLAAGDCVNFGIRAVYITSGFTGASIIAPSVGEGAGNVLVPYWLGTEE